MAVCNLTLAVVCHKGFNDGCLPNLKVNFEFSLYQMETDSITSSSASSSTDSSTGFAINNDIFSVLFSDE